MLHVVRVGEHSFLDAPMLRERAVVVDLGCNYGAFATEMMRRYGAEVYAVEPVPELFAQLAKLPHLHVDQLAIVSGVEDTVELFINDSSCATLDARLREVDASAVAVPAERLERLLERHSLKHVDVLKVDIEGAETEMLLRAPAEVLKSITQITVEFHDFLDPSLGPQVAAAHDRMRQLGFWAIRFSRGNEDVLFVNTARLPMSGVQRLWTTLRYRYLRGLMRIVARRRTR